ncbi:MAG: hypothetical protein JWQ09_5201, partial [Segetibacter sp.]|nr:hypothetical protein [Segetibacter sp.]
RQCCCYFTSLRRTLVRFVQYGNNEMNLQGGKYSYTELQNERSSKQI